MTTTTTQPKTFTPAQLKQIMDAMYETLEGVRDRAFDAGTPVGLERVQNIEFFLTKWAMNLDATGWWEWRVGILFKIREARAAKEWLAYYQAIGQCMDAVMTLPTGVDLDAVDPLDRGCLERESCF